MLFPARPLRAVLLGASLLAVPASTWAQQAPAYHQLLTEAQGRAPRLAASEADTRAAEALALQAAARPNPTLNLDVENFAGTGPYKAFGQSETTLSVQQPLDIGGRRGARISAAEAEVSVAQARALQTRTDFARDLANAYVEAEAALEARRLAGEALSLAEDDARAARLLVDNGKEAEVRALQAQTVLASARAAKAAAAAQAEEGLIRLAILAGAQAPYRELVGGELDRVAAPAAASTSPAVTLAQAERDAAVRRVDVARAQGRPDVAVSVGVRRLAGDDATTGYAGVSMPLPVRDRNRGAIQATRDTVLASTLRLRAAEVEAEGERRLAASRLVAAASSLEAARQGEAAAAETYRLARLGYDAGRLPLADVLTARQGLIDARRRILDARLARAKAQIALAHAQGQIPFGDAP